MPHPNSPNGCWSRHGYRSEAPADRPSARCRNIYAPNGTLVLENAFYDDQMAYCIANGMLLPEAVLEE